MASLDTWALFVLFALCLSLSCHHRGQHVRSQLLTRKPSPLSAPLANEWSPRNTITGHSASQGSAHARLIYSPTQVWALLDGPGVASSQKAGLAHTFFFSLIHSLPLWWIEALFPGPQSPIMGLYVHLLCHVTLQSLPLEWPNYPPPPH